MLGTIHVFDFLDGDPPRSLPTLVVLSGSQSFLTSLALRHLRRQEAVNEWSEVRLDAETATWTDVSDEMSAKSLFAADQTKRILMTHADKFITENRERLEDLLTRPVNNNVLILTAAKWLKTTRLHKQISDKGLFIDCVPPQRQVGKNTVIDARKVTAWLRKWAAATHGVHLQTDAVHRLGELTQYDFGRIDQELEKIALLAENPNEVTADQVQHIVGGWQLQTVWKIAELIVAGDAPQALELIDRLFRSGEDAFGIFAQLAWSLRRYSQAFELHCRALRRNPKARLQDSLSRVFRDFELGNAARGIARIGTRRLAQLSQRLLEIDLAMKRTHSQDQRGRLLLEQLVVWLADAKPAAKAVPH